MVLTAGLLATAACSGSVAPDDLRTAGGVITGLTVSGDPGSAPAVRMRTPLKVEETTSVVTVAGTGAPVAVDQLFVLELVLYDARTGKLAASTYETGTAVAAKSSDDRLFPKLSEALVGVRQGSRVVLATRAADAYATGGTPPPGVRREDPVVVVADVVAVPPTKVLDSIDGTAASHVPASPTLVVTDGVPTGISFAHAGDATALRAYPLVEGTGPEIRAHDLVTVDYIAQRSKEHEPFADTFFKEPEQVAIGTGTAPTGWDTLLVGVRRGSRVLLYGPDEDGMIAWVVDVLGVS